MTGRMTIPTANVRFSATPSSEKTDPDRLRQRPTTGNENIDVLGPSLQFLVVVRCRNHLATLLSSYSHHRKSRICRWNFDDIGLCHTVTEILVLLRPPGFEPRGAFNVAYHAHSTVRRTLGSQL